MITSAATLVEPFVVRSSSDQASSYIPITNTAMRASVTQVSEKFKAEKQLYADKLILIEKDMDKYITDNPGDPGHQDMVEIKEEIKKARSRLDQIKKRKDVLNPSRFAELKTEQDTRKRQSLRTINPLSNRKLKKKFNGSIIA